MDGDKVPDNWEIWPSPKIRQLYEMVRETRDGGIVAVILNCNTCGKVVEEKPWMVKQPDQNWTDTSNGSFKQKFSNRLSKLKPCCTTAGADAPSKASWLQNNECSAPFMPVRMPHSNRACWAPPILSFALCSLPLPVEDPPPLPHRTLTGRLGGVGC